MKIIKKTIPIMLILALFCTVFGACSSQSESKITSASDVSKIEKTLANSDPFSFEFIINEDKYELPCSASDLITSGWVPSEDKEIPANGTNMVKLYNGENYISVNLYNDTEKTIKYSDATVTKVTFNSAGLGDSIALISGDLKIGSTKDELFKIYGSEPNIEYGGENEVYWGLEYEGSHFFERVCFTLSEGVISEISLFVSVL